MKEKLEKIEDISNAIQTINAEPKLKIEIYDYLTSDVNFGRLVNNTYDVKILVSNFSEHKEDLFKLVTESKNFNRFTSNLYKVLDLVDIFPEHKEDFFRLIINGENFTRLITQGFNAGELDKHFSGHTEEIIQLVIDHHFNRIVNLDYDLRCLVNDFPQYQELYRQSIKSNTHTVLACADIFPEHREDVYQFITHPENFPRLITDLGKLVDLAKKFLEHDKDIQKLYMKPENFMRFQWREDARNAFINSPTIQAYTRGAAIGFFSRRPEGELIPEELAEYIGTFLDRKSGGQLAQTRRSAATEANLAQAKMEEAGDNTPSPQN